MATFQHEIEAANRMFMQAVKMRDEDAFVSLYTEDAILLLPGRDPLFGLPGVRVFFSSFVTRGICEIQLMTLEFEATGDTAWERGSSEAYGAGGAIASKGKYIVIWKQIAGNWKLHRDILNASA